MHTGEEEAASNGLGWIQSAGDRHGSHEIVGQERNDQTKKLGKEPYPNLLG
jgi:hypothetical protein